MTATWVEPTTTYFVNEHSTTWLNWPNDWAKLWILIGTMHLTLCYHQVTYAVQSESIFYIFLNIKELLARNRCDIWRLSNCNWIRTHNHLAQKATLNQLAEPTKWLSWVVSTYLHGAFFCLLLSCHIRISEWVHNTYLRECQGTLCLKQTRYLKIKWLQLDSNHEPLSS